MEKFVNIILAAERKLASSIEDGKSPSEAKTEWCETVWQARNWLPADPATIAQEAGSWLADFEKRKFKSIHPIPDIPDIQKSAERRAMEAAGFVGAKGPDPHSIAVCRREGELLRPLAHYWHKSRWWNLVKPPAGTKATGGRGMAELINILREAK